MILVKYIREKIKEIVLIITFAILLLILFYLYSMPMEAYIYAISFLAAMLVILTSIHFLKLYTNHRILIKHLNLKDTYTLDMKASNKIIEKDYQMLVNKLIDEKSQLCARQMKNITEMNDYYTMWAHQIKTPISALNLMFQVLEETDQNSVDVKEMKQELFKVEFYVEAVLQYLRLEDMSSDFKFEYYNLEAIIKQSVKKFASQFIYKKVKIELGNLGIRVLTDEKWLSFVIEQILSNSVKYTKPDGMVRIYLQEPYLNDHIILVIEDSGIGICGEDLPRIFERGFTGYNGRMDKKSTGIGLYLCKKAITKLSHKISIESELGVGTKVFIDLSSNDMIHE